MIYSGLLIQPFCKFNHLHRLKRFYWKVKQMSAEDPLGKFGTISIRIILNFRIRGANRRLAARTRLRSHFNETQQLCHRANDPRYIFPEPSQTRLPVMNIHGWRLWFEFQLFRSSDAEFSLGLKLFCEVRASKFDAFFTKRSPRCDDCDASFCVFKKASWRLNLGLLKYCNYNHEYKHCLAS